MGLAHEAAERLEAFFRGFAGSTAPLLLLDYDVTLAPFRVDRFKAKPWAGVSELLNRIQGQTKTQMVFITGRPAAEILPLLGLDAPVEVWGLHGTERLYPDGSRELEPVPAAVRKVLDDLREQLNRDSFGGLFEDKDNAAVMHWRGVSAARAKQIEQRTRKLFEPLARLDGLVLLEFSAGLELRAGRDKGGAVEAILKEKGAIGPAAYLGDDFTDEAAFEALQGRGLSVLVRREWRETAADVWLRPPAELKKFLTQWLEACRMQGQGRLSSS